MQKVNAEIPVQNILKLKIREEIIQNANVMKGSFQETDFITAVKLTRCVLYSDRQGKYVLSKEAPGLFWNRLATPPAVLDFDHNSIMKIVRMKMGGMILSRVNY